MEETLRFLPSFDSNNSDEILTSLILYHTEFIRFNMNWDTSTAVVILFPRAVIVTIDNDESCVNVELTYVIIGFFPIGIVFRVSRS